MTPKELYDWAMAFANMDDGWRSKYNGTKLRIESSGQEVVYLNNGAYGTVFEHRECPGVVVKVSQMSDGYLAFATYAKVNPAPCFPTVYECGYDNSASVCITVMEKLDCTATAAACYDYQFLADDLRQVWKGTRKVSPRTEAWQYWPQLQAMAEFFGDSVGYDLHGSNWMMRGEQLVLTDPFAGTYGATPQELTTRVKQHKPFRPPVVEQIEMDLGPARLEPVRDAVGTRAIDKAALDAKVVAEVSNAFRNMPLADRLEWGRLAAAHKPWQGAGRRGLAFTLARAIPDDVGFCRTEHLTLSCAAWKWIAQQHEAREVMKGFEAAWPMAKRGADWARPKFLEV